MNKLHKKCIVVEDNKDARELIVYYIGCSENLELIQAFADMSSAMDTIKKHPNTILFLDIFLKSENSIDFINQQKLVNPIVFLTGHKQFAHIAFNLDAIDYLVKPITRTQFDKSVHKIFQKLRLFETNYKNDEFIFITVNRTKYKLFLNAILYVESDREYCLFHTKTNIYKTKLTLTKTEELLDNEKFIKIHRSFIINPLFVEMVLKDHVKVNEKLLPISRSYKASVRKHLL